MVAPFRHLCREAFLKFFHLDRPHHKILQRGSVPVR
jgi:hypothetical protein